MPKKIIALSLVIFVLLSALMIIQNYAKDVLPSKTKLPQNSNEKLAPTNNTSAMIYILPNQLNVTPGKPTSLTISLESLVSPDLMQFEIEYDPTALANMAITPGTFFTNPHVLLQLINETTGRISYAFEASTEQDRTRTKGDVAILHFIPRPEALRKETKIFFLPKTSVRTNAGQNVLKAAYGATIFIQAQ